MNIIFPEPYEIPAEMSQHQEVEQVSYDLFGLRSLDLNYDVESLHSAYHEEEFYQPIDQIFAFGDLLVVP